MRIKNRGKENSGNARVGQSSSEAHSQILFCNKLGHFQWSQKCLRNFYQKKREAYFNLFFALF